MPRAVPGKTLAIGLPPLFVLGSIPARSILRSMAWIFEMAENNACAGAWPACDVIAPNTFRSIPAAKSGFALVMMIPLMASSAKAVSIKPFNACKASMVMMFIALPSQSQMIVAMPLVSWVRVKSVISKSSRGRGCRRFGCSGALLHPCG